MDKPSGLMSVNYVQITVLFLDKSSHFCFSELLKNYIKFPVFGVTSVAKKEIFRLKISWQLPRVQGNC